jgi:PIN domain nuclease of toxin-antitoxin system
MILLDAYAVIAYLRGEPHAGAEVRSLLSDGAITAVNAAEVLDHLVRVQGAGEAEAALDVAQLGLQIIDVDEEIATRAGLFRARHYHRTDRAVSLADCVAAAAALIDPRLDALATSDPHLLDLLQAEGGGVQPLPDRRGVVWQST